MDKAEIIAAVIGQLEQQLQTLVASAKSARENATSEESRPENEYDTRGLEASYLAGAQAARAEQLKAEMSVLRQLAVRTFKKSDAIDLTALIDVEDEDGKKALYLLAPGRGLTLSIGGKTVQVITPQSPLGRELLGKHVGDDVEVEVRGEARGYTIRGLR